MKIVVSNGEVLYSIIYFFDFFFLRTCIPKHDNIIKIVVVVFLVGIPLSYYY
jgi:hypothetical protein